MNIKHGMSHTRVFKIWLGMIDRCRNKRRNYGKRNIQVCDRWLNSFSAFYVDMGEPPSRKHSIDRIDTYGNYEPDNCRWATRQEQARNTSSNTILSHKGQGKTIAEWSEITGIKSVTICARIYSYGWNVSKALTEQPLKKLPSVKPWTQIGLSRSSWYRAGRPMP